LADATVVKVVDIHNPNMEVVRLTASDGETYTSRKFGQIEGAVAMSNDDSDAALNIEFSSGVATINWASITDGNLTLVLYGTIGK